MSSRNYGCRSIQEEPLKSQLFWQGINKTLEERSLSSFSGNYKEYSTRKRPVTTRRRAGECYVHEEIPKGQGVELHNPFFREKSIGVRW